jgi:hypothetical protein
MAYITIDGQEMLARNLDTARIRDVAELQRQSGWKLEQIRNQVQEADVLGAAILLFLTLAAYGHGPKWEEILDRDLTLFEGLKQDPQELAIEAEQRGDVEDPSVSPPDSDPGDDGAQ